MWHPRSVLRLPATQEKAAREDGDVTLHGETQTVSVRLKIESEWTVPAVEFSTGKDAGTTIVLAKGGGIRSITEQSIAGPRSLTRLEGGCADREKVEFELYVEPAPARNP